MSRTRRPDAPGATQKLHQSVRRVLIVEDELAVAEICSTVLTRSGFRVRVAHNGRDALAAVAKHHYDVAVIDCRLPDMSGIALHGEIREIRPTLAKRTLFMSGMHQSQFNNYFAQAGTPFLAKPFGARQLLAFVRWMLLGDPRHRKPRRGSTRSHRVTGRRAVSSPPVRHPRPSAGS